MPKATVFVPSFGNRPGVLVGRDKIIDQFLSGLQRPPGSKERAVLFLGQRGFGKTVLLLELADLAKNQGFVVVSPTIVSPGMQERIVEKLQEEGERFLKKNKRKLSGGSLGAFGFSAGLQFSDMERETKSFSYISLNTSSISITLPQPPLSFCGSLLGRFPIPFKCLC